MRVKVGRVDQAGSEIQQQYICMYIHTYIHEYRLHESNVIKSGTIQVCMYKCTSRTYVLCVYTHLVHFMREMATSNAHQSATHLVFDGRQGESQEQKIK